ncbi:MAG: hypothetical protein AB1746_03360 [Candidatus Zixiibacteriota bacterium]
MKSYRMLSIPVIFLLLIGCGNQETAQNSSSPGVTTEETSDEATIRALMIEYIERTKEGDKTVLYENEFPYYKDLISLTEYMEYRWVRDYEYNRLSSIEVDSLRIFGDSATVWIRLSYGIDVPEGEWRSYAAKVYRSHGKWYRPYQSHYDKQLENDAEIKAYEEAVRREQQEQEGK